MQRPVNLFAFLGFFFGFLLLGGCFKDVTENDAEEEQIIENAAIAQQQADEALEMIYQCEVILKLHPGITISLDTCAVFYEDPVHKTIVLDFGSKVPTCRTFYNRYRQGKIIASYTTFVGDTLNERVLTFENYKTTASITSPTGYIQLDGTVTLSNQVQTTPSIITADRTLTDFKVTLPNGSGITFNGTQQRLWTGGMSDTLEFNNVYSLRGTMNGTSGSGRNFEQAISGLVPVVINFDCASRGYFARTSGLIDLLKLDGYPDRTRIVNYGDGTCTNNTVTVQTFRGTFAVSGY